MWPIFFVHNIMVDLEASDIMIFFETWTFSKGWARAKFFQGSDEFMSKVSAGIAAEIV